MTDQLASVVPSVAPPTEAEFHAEMLVGLARCGNTEERLRRLAAAMDLSTKQVKNILKGALPGPKRLWDATLACPTALDNVAALYGFELVRVGEVATSDLGTVPLAALLAQVAEAESPTSHGGTSKTHQELLAMEALIRSVHSLTAGWINEINKHRAPPRAVAG